MPEADCIRSALVAELRRPEPDEGPKHADRLKGTTYRKFWGKPGRTLNKEPVCRFNCKRQPGRQGSEKEEGKTKI